MSQGPQFLGFHSRTARFACIVAMRRAGKTLACIHDLQRAALRRPHGQRHTFAYIAPTYSQAKSVAWDYLETPPAPSCLTGRWPTSQN